MDKITCPVCAGPIELTGAEATCRIGHVLQPEAFQSNVEHEASRALWSAVRALEDTASGARWRATLPHPPAHLDSTIARATHHARLLRGLIAQRDGGTSETDNRPEDW